MGLVKRGRTTLAAAATAAVLLGAGGAYAVTSSAGGTLSACVHSKGGTLYEARHCARHDRKLIWNVAGPQGVPGPSGPAGKNGSDGVNGTNGTNGIGAVEFPFNLQVGNFQVDLGALGPNAELYGVCNATGGVIRVALMVDAGLGEFLASGSYEVYDSVTNGGTAAASTASGPPTKTWAISNVADIVSGSPSALNLMAENAPSSGNTLYAGAVNVSVAGGTSNHADYQIDFDIYAIPGIPDSCNGELTAYPA